MENNNRKSLEEVKVLFDDLKTTQPEILEALFYLEELKFFNPDETFLVKEMPLERYQTSAYLMDTSYYKTVSRMLPKAVIEKLKADTDEIR